jgi:hypothetical protein
VLKESTVLGMVDMLHSVVENGTGKRARIPGVHVAGKTGTTNSYRDAWFVGFTGNFSTAVWFGNDDFQMTKRLTGGILPAQTWQKYMRVAMAFEEAKPLPGLPPPAPAEDEPDAEAVAAADGGVPDVISPGASGRLSPETSATLGRLEERFKTVATPAPVREAALRPAEPPTGSRLVRIAGSVLLIAGLSLVIGVWTAWLAVRSPAPIDAISLGAWQAWPNAGTANVDPYSRATLARTGEIPLGSGEGLMLLARTDDAGQVLTSRCDYTVTGQTPPARLWTLTIEDGAGRVVAQGDQIAAIGSDVLLREPDGSFEIVLSPAPRGGNWVPTGRASQFRVVVRLYDTTARMVTALTTLSMPQIVRERCA